MGIFKKANNIYITVRDTYTSISGESYEEAEEVTITATEEVELISAKKVIMQGLEGGVQYGTVNKIGEEVYLVIEGKNLSGKEADLDLTDNEIDFEYNGERLKNDILKGYVFKDDKTERIKLKIIEQKNN